MALTIISRPEKTLDNGYLSRWNASRTPLQYKFSSDLFPVNNVDPIKQADSGQYDASLRGFKVEITAHGYLVNQFVQLFFNGSGSLGIYKVIAVVDANFFVVDYFTDVIYTDDLRAQRYYKGYKGIIKVFAGAPEYHPYNTDGSKPQVEIGEIQVDFDANNEGICNVRNFVKPDMSADFDYNDENSHEAWTSFAIEYTEVWDNQANLIPLQLTY